jgi:hypothetical protein
MKPLWPRIQHKEDEDTECVAGGATQAKHKQSENVRTLDCKRETVPPCSRFAVKHMHDADLWSCGAAVYCVEWKDAVSGGHFASKCVCDFGLNLWFHPRSYETS